MAKVLFGGGVAEMRRSLEGNTFSRNKGGAYVRQRVRPTNPQTVPQTRLRDTLGFLSKNWATGLSPAQRNAWVAFAETNTFVDVLGESLTLSGIQMYLKLNMRLRQVDLTKINDPPPNLDVTQLTDLTVTFDKSATTTYSVSFSPSLAGGEALQIFATPALSPGVTFIKNRVRQITLAEIDAADPFDATADWQARFGVLPPDGTLIATQARVIRPSNGAISVPIRDDTIVVTS